MLDFEVIALFQGFLVYFYLINNTNTVRMCGLSSMPFAAQALEALWLIFQYVTGLNYTIKGVFVVPVRDQVGFRSGGFAGRDVVFKTDDLILGSHGAGILLWDRGTERAA